MGDQGNNVQYPAVPEAGGGEVQEPEQHQQQPVVEPGEQPQQAAAPNENEELERVKREVALLKKSVEEMTKLNVAGLLAKALDYATRPASEFNKYDLLKILETLQNTARDTKHEKREYYQLCTKVPGTRWIFRTSTSGWDDPFPWRDERHVVISVATDASGTGWCGKVLSPGGREISDYSSQGEMSRDIATKEAMAVERVLSPLSDEVRGARVDAKVDNQAVIHVWNNQGGRSKPLNDAVKQLFFTVARLNVLLQLAYIPTGGNPADSPSRRRSRLDCTLTPQVWERIEDEYGDTGGHTFDLISLASNAMKDREGNMLPHFTPHTTPESLGVNLLAQDLSSYGEESVRVSAPSSSGSSAAVFEIFQTVMYGSGSGRIPKKLLVALVASLLVKGM
ncbi:hypothetical protein AC249_AIPGENE19266 [Exaiptasia diaphana]|nr:hypothetical protein AC249_AIPGENE19266 [Exaiptasia diaphana]